MKKHICSCVQIISVCASLILAVAVFVYYIQYKALHPRHVDVTTEINFLTDISRSQRDICITKDCNETVKILKKNMNMNVDPCNNFYEFVCGNFIKNSNIATDEPSTETIQLISNKVEERLKQIIEEPIQDEDIEPFVLAKQFFKACMNEKIIEERGLTPLTDILKKLGGWPVLEQNNWNETNFSWNKTINEMDKLGFISDIIFSFYIDNDAINNTKHIITIDEAILSVNREYLIQGLENNVVKAYFEYINKIADYLGVNIIDSRTELKEILSFQMKLANLKLPIKERRNVSNLYNPISIKQLQKDYPTISWLNYINNLLHSEVNINDDEIIIITEPNYIKEVEKLLNNTSKRTLANYIIWNAISQAASYLPKNFRELSFDFDSVISGISEQPSRRRECVQIVTNSINVAIGSLYVRKFFDKESKIQMTDLVRHMQMEFKDMLEHVNWMDNNTRKNALEKIYNLYAHVAYPEEFMDDDSIIKYYKDLKFDENMYFESMLNLSLFVTRKEILKLRKPFNKTMWYRHSNTAEVNAYYSALENSIELPAGILQEEFFLKDRPKYVNYGGIGFVIGHEITHGFDDLGRVFDKDGNLFDWWDPDTKEAFIKKTKCIVNQYGNYSIGNLTLNGENTLGENIADNGGAKCAYRAYKRWKENNGDEPKLPGLNFTPEQMIWINMATTWCTNYRLEYLRNIMTTDSHSPAEFRVNGVVSNQKEFAIDFGCPSNAPMNPENKCNIW